MRGRKEREGEINKEMGRGERDGGGLKGKMAMEKERKRK